MVAGWLRDLLFVRMQSKPLLQARNGTEGPGVELRFDCLPVDGCAICQTIETQTFVRVGPHVWLAVSEPQGTSVFDFTNFNEALHAGGDLKCLKSFHRSSLRLMPTGP